MSATPDSIAIPELLARIYPDLAADDSPEWLALLRQARIVETPAGASLVRAGDHCTRFLLLLDGTLRIFQLAEDGREVTLYRIHPGDTCLM
ncbi:MAG TPA: cyclic nucleotide-binding domain-containing protein, partial [Gammaproteobacteria bacterium]|nr:cyclic nucleotide-binding domain-containing protein [Gammaproteobacteria bacterium]